MRSAIGFLSLLAFGFLAVGMLTVIGSAPGSEFNLDTAVGANPAGIHLGSLLIGLVLGIVVSALARVSWTELPRRFVSWMLEHERGFYRIVLAAAFIGILIYY